MPAPLSTPTLFVSLRNNSEKPAFRQIADQIRARIESGGLKAGDRLPGVRTLARSLGISADTVQSAYEVLLGEGLVLSRPRSGFFVSKAASVSRSSFHPSIALPAEEPRLRLGRRARVAEEVARHRMVPRVERKPFAIIPPPLSQAAEKLWTTEAARLARSPWLHQGHADSLGFRPLREALALRLRQYRGIDASPENILITTGTVQSLALSLDVLFSPGDRVLIEAPARPFLASELLWRDLVPEWVPVDRDGMKTEEGVARVPDAVGAIVTPASEMPLAVPMSRARKKSLLLWAKRTGAWLIENDSPNTFRYSDTPELSLRGCPFGDERVLYCGSFASLLGPGSHAAYVVSPERVTDALLGAKLLSDHSTSEATQALLASFLESEAFDSHLRKTEGVLRERLGLLRECFGEPMSDFGALSGTLAGTQAAFVFRREFRSDDRELAAALARRGVIVKPLSAYPAGGNERPRGFVLGFGAFEPEAIREASGVIREVLSEAGKGKS